MRPEAHEQQSDSFAKCWVILMSVHRESSNGNLATQTDGNGHTTRYEYDDANRLVKAIDATDAEVTYTHDQNGRIETVTDAAGFASRTVYDDFGRVEQQIRDDGGLNLTSSFTYDLNNNLDMATAPDGTVTCYEYDDLNRQTAVIQDCGTGLLNLRTETVYDLNGNIVTTTDERGIVTYSQYDSLNRVTLTRQDDGGLNLPTTFAYNVQGLLESSTDERGVVTRHFYDDLFRMTQSCADDTGLNLCSSFGYDRLNNQETATDAEGVTILTTYNAFGMPLLMVADSGGLNNTTSYQYDNALNLIRYTDDNSNSTIFKYTDRNQMADEIYADGTTVAYTYDDRGNIDTRTDQEGVILTFTFDGAGRETAVSYSGGGSQSSQFDAMGRVTQVSETANGHSTVLTYGYNPIGDVINTTQEIDGVGGTTWQVDYAYSYPSGTYTVTYPSGVDAIYSMDPLGRLDLVEQDSGSLATVGDYTYDDLNSFFEISYGNSVVNRFDYDALFRTTSVQLTSGATTLANYGYGYDDVGNRTYMQRNHVAGTPADVYAYDTLYQLTQTWYDADAVTPATLTTFSDQQTYTLDNLGNRLAVDFDDGTSVTTQDYGLHNSDQLLNEMNRYDVVDGSSLSYDLRGNTLADGATLNSYGYDVLNRQISLDDGTTNSEYIYDGMGRRVAKIVDGTTTYFIYDKQFRVIEERSSEAVWEARYTYGDGIDEPLMMERNSATYYLHRDALGSVTEVTDSGGTLVERYEYDVYGQPEFYDGSYSVITSSAIDNPYLFTGRRYDPESGNYYYRARIYSPILGRFLSMDPLGFEAGDANLYRYAFNNPANLTDPTGEIVPFIVVALALTKVIDYGITAVDIIRSSIILADPCSPPEELLLASLNIALAIVFEAGEPDDMTPVGIPADDIARRAAMRGARRAMQEEGIEGFVHYVRRNFGEAGDDFLRQMGLFDQYIDDATRKADDVVRAVCSFSSDTLVSTAYGFAAISELKEGQYVLAFDEATGTLIYAPILATWVHEDPVIVHLTIGGELVETTPQHPFKLANGEYVAAIDLQIDDLIHQANGQASPVEAIQIEYTPQPMYNLTIATAHTFFVGEGQWLVHNTCFPLGFNSFEEFQRFGSGLYSGLGRAGYSDVTAIFQGSSVTGVGFRTGEPFDVGRISDFDIALASPELLQRAKELGIGLRSQGVRTGPLKAEDLALLGLTDVVRQLSQQAGRPVNFMIYNSAETAIERTSKNIIVP